MPERDPGLHVHVLRRLDHLRLHAFSFADGPFAFAASTRIVYLLSCTDYILEIRLSILTFWFLRNTVLVMRRYPIAVVSPHTAFVTCCVEFFGLVLCHGHVMGLFVPVWVVM